MLKTTDSSVRILKLMCILFALVLMGCAGAVKGMREIPDDQAADVPQEGKALIVFIRPSGMAYAVQSSVFELVDDYPELVGIVAAKKKVAYHLDPGEHLFMVIGEAADFMTAEVQAGKTYYALVTPRMGAWKARFSLKPVHKNETDSEQFTDWVNGCRWVEKTPESQQWADTHMADIRAKQQRYMDVWMQKAESDRPKLYAEDGI
jgi:hypothetical protein